MDCFQCFDEPRSVRLLSRHSISSPQYPPPSICIIHLLGSEDPITTTCIASIIAIVSHKTYSGVAKPRPTQALAQALAHLALASGIGDQFIFLTANGITGPTISLCGPTISISTYHMNSTLYKTID